jgi:diacylglycerol kinase family enzyme
MEDKLKKENKHVDYKKIGKRGILKTKPFNTTIIVDGKTYVHSNVWFASCMKGRYNGSGMMLSPLQDRTTGDVSLIVFTQKSKLKALKLFSKIFKKNHLENTESFIVYTGKLIEVTSNIPLTLHIDGEKVIDVTTYKVSSTNLKSKFLGIKPAPIPSIILSLSKGNTPIQIVFLFTSFNLLAQPVNVAPVPMPQINTSTFPFTFEIISLEVVS